MEPPTTLIHAATAVAARAHSPYSKAQVGCALFTKAGAMYTGCNVENASYGLTICAERNAVFAGVTAEGGAFRIRELAVLALGLEFPPCGACRQVIAEFSSPDTLVWFMQNGAWTCLSMAELLPAAFRLVKD